MKISFFVSVVFFLIANAQAQDSKPYKFVKIGNQVWMVENLNITAYRNGDTIPQVQDSVAWSKLTTGAWCYYENKTTNGIRYGKLYNWYAVNDPRGLAPAGWHIPGSNEWTILMKELGLTSECVSDSCKKRIGDMLKSTNGWPVIEEVSYNSSGFTGLPGGMRDRLGVFRSIGLFGYWWSSNVNTVLYGGDIGKRLPFGCGLGYAVYTIAGNPSEGWSVRCLKD